MSILLIETNEDSMFTVDIALAFQNYVLAT
jgi:hypothetical protein